MSVPVNLGPLSSPGSLAGSQVSPPPPLLERFRSLVGTALANVNRAGEILDSMEHGPKPAEDTEGKPCLAGLEDIYDVLRDAIHTIEDRLILIGDKLGD